MTHDFVHSTSWPDSTNTHQGANNVCPKGPEGWLAGVKRDRERWRSYCFHCQSHTDWGLSWLKPEGVWVCVCVWTTGTEWPCVCSFPPSAIVWESRLGMCRENTLRNLCRSKESSSMEVYQRVTNKSPLNKVISTSKLWKEGTFFSLDSVPLPQFYIRDLRILMQMVPRNRHQHNGNTASWHSLKELVVVFQLLDMKRLPLQLGPLAKNVCLWKVLSSTVGSAHQISLTVLKIVYRVKSSVVI